MTNQRSHTVYIATLKFLFDVYMCAHKMFAGLFVYVYAYASDCVWISNIVGGKQILSSYGEFTWIKEIVSRRKKKGMLSQ